MAHDDEIKRFDALMALLDEALDAMTDEEVLEELGIQGISAKQSTDTFYTVLESAAIAQRKSIMDAALAEREKKVAVYHTGPSRIPSGSTEQLELYQKFRSARPDMTMAARNESGPPTPSDIKIILRQLEAMGLLDEFLSDKDAKT